MTKIMIKFGQELLDFLKENYEHGCFAISCENCVLASSTNMYLCKVMIKISKEKEV